jgi:hypothetical protein
VIIAVTELVDVEESVVRVLTSRHIIYAVKPWVVTKTVSVFGFKRVLESLPAAVWYAL